MRFCLLAAPPLLGEAAVLRGQEAKAFIRTKLLPGEDPARETLSHKPQGLLAWEAGRRGSLQDELFPYLGLVTCDHLRAEAPWRLAGAHKQGRPPGIDLSRASALAPTGGMKPRLRTNDPRVRQLPIPEHSIPSSCMDVY